MELERIIEGCKSGNRKSQQELFDLYYDKMMRIALFYCKNEVDAENSVLESFMYVFFNISKFRGESKLITWVRRIVINKSISNYNKNIKRQELELSIENLEYKSVVDKIDLNFDFEASYILNIIQSLPDIQRVVFNLYVIEGYNHKEIAQKLNIQESTCRWHFASAKKNLQVKLASINMNK